MTFLTASSVRPTVVALLALGRDYLAFLWRESTSVCCATTRRSSVGEW